MIFRKIIVTVICFFLLTGLVPSDLFGNQRYVIQVAASKTPLDIHNFAIYNRITDSITVLADSDWYRYTVGNFQSFKKATAYASELIKNTRLTSVFVRELISSTDSNLDFDDNQTVEEINSTQIQPEDSANSKTDTIALNTSDTAESPAIQILQDTIIKNFGSETDGISTSETWTERIIHVLRDHIPNYLQKLFNSYPKKKYGYKIVLLFMFIIFLFLLNIFTVILIFNYSNQKKNYNERYLAVYQKIYESALLSYILGESDWDKTKARLKKADEPLNRSLLSSILLNFHENLRGSADQIIPEIFIKLGLHTDAISEAQSKIYYEKIHGIKKLSYLYPEGAQEIVPELINHPDDLVRAEAQTAYIRINHEAPFDFLKILEKPFTRWTQLTAFHLFRLRLLPIPSFVNYLNSSHMNVRNFSLRMINFYQQLENTPEILKMLESPVETTRFLSIKAINDLRLYEGKPLIKKRFSVETGKNKAEIVKAFKNIGSEEDFDFLEEIIKNGNETLKTEACRSLYFMSQEGKDRLLKLNEEMENKLEIYILHVTDPRN